MVNTEEQRLDIIENCNVLLKKFANFEQSDRTPEGRLLAQLNWLKERAENVDLALPVDRAYVSTLAYIYTDGTLTHHASAEDKIREEINIPMSNLLGLAEEAELLYKPVYSPYTIRCIDALIHSFLNASFALNEYESGFVQELYQIKQGFIAGELVPPVGGCAQYPNLIEVEYLGFKDSNSKLLFKIVNNLIFSGVRPDSWLTPEDAERETLKLLG
ncbi:hypothetical protein [Psychromonas antarctica]|uniref:hypothetical protein n=1 Tax=Psychromonas antarctica TaxID=67573 RepID=UPI001EE98731|nr:hypothetical protein [Psychromonas antarctica]MCG6202814.1 hypothetical protein [Psychromonas antarctica]